MAKICGCLAAQGLGFRCRCLSRTGFHTGGVTGNRRCRCQVVGVGRGLGHCCTRTPPRRIAGTCSRHGGPVDGCGCCGSGVLGDGCAGHAVPCSVDGETDRGDGPGRKYRELAAGTRPKKLPKPTRRPGAEATRGRPEQDARPDHGGRGDSGSHKCVSKVARKWHGTLATTWVTV